MPARLLCALSLIWLTLAACNPAPTAVAPAPVRTAIATPTTPTPPQPTPGSPSALPPAPTAPTPTSPSDLPPTPTPPDTAAAAPPAPLSPEDLAAFTASLPETAWYGAYLGDRKVGFAEIWARLAEDNEPGHFAMGVHMSMSVTGGDQRNALAVTELRFYDGKPPFALRETRMITKASAFTEERVATRIDGPTPRMRVTRTRPGGAPASREVPISEDTLSSQLLSAPRNFKELVNNFHADGVLWSWEQERDERFSVALAARTTQMRAGIPEEVATFNVTYPASGLTSTLEVAAGGTVLVLRVGAALTLRLEEQGVAQSNVTGMDIAATGLRSPTPLGAPDRVRALTLELTTSAPLELADAPNQRITRKDPKTLEINLVQAPGAVVSAEERAAALLPDPIVDSDHPSLIAQAQALLRGAPDAPDTRTDLLARFVFTSLDKRLATHLPTASTVLEHKVGDCTEHTWLTLGLLRAAKIPARAAYGVAYTGDRDQAFNYHAWVEVALPDAAGVERWTPIDPTWGEARADATHLRLGGTLSEAARALGAVTITRATITP